MQSFKAFFYALAASFLLLCTSHAQNRDYKKEFGPYVVHYNAFNSSSLTPEIAKNYRITRANNIGVVMISVHKKNDDQTPDAVTAMIKGEVRNELFQSSTLEFRELIEGAAIYYVAPFRHDHNEMMGFSVNVKPEGHKDELAISFSQRFYTH